MDSTQQLTRQQQAIIPVAAFAAAGDIDNLNDALNYGLDAGLTINDIKEILVQVYPYAGFPRSLNALGSFMAVLEKRQRKGITDKAGSIPDMPAPVGNELLLLGTANQTKLAGGPVSGALFDFSPTIDFFLKTHLFGDVFSRNNISWQDREIATIAMLSAIDGTESQLKAHVGIGLNIKLTKRQLYVIIDILAENVNSIIADRVRTALSQYN